MSVDRVLFVSSGTGRPRQRESLSVDLSLNPALAATSQLLDEMGGALADAGTGTSAALLAQIVMAFAVFEARHRGVSLDVPGSRRKPTGAWRDQIVESPADWLATLHPN